MAELTPDPLQIDLAKIIVARYGNSGVRLATHPSLTDKALRDRITRGEYEVHEGQTVKKMLVAGDVVVELGAGLGLVSTLAAKTGLPKAIHCYEADPRLPEVIRQTHRLNEVAGVTVTTAAITSDPGALANGHVSIHLRANFWANSLVAPAIKRPRMKVQVPAKSLAEIVKDFRPTVIICDIEGAEDGLFDGVDLSGVRHVLVELHPKVIGAAGVARVFDALRKGGLAHDPALSMKAVPGFTRLPN